MDVRDMKSALGLLTVAMLLAASLFIMVDFEDSAVEADGVWDPMTHYVDDGPGSTYDNVQDALLFANPGDTIVVAPGTYVEAIDLDKDDLTIIGNITEGEVKIISPAGPAIIIHDCRRIHIQGINFTSSDNSGIMIDRTDNVTLEGCTAWSTGGTFGAMAVLDSQHISCHSLVDLKTYYPTFHAEGPTNVGIHLDRVHTFLGYSLDVYTMGDGSHSVHSMNLLHNSSISCHELAAWGLDSSNFDLDGSTDLYLFSIYDPVYTKRFIELEDGNVEMWRIWFPENDVNIGPGGNVFMSQDVWVFVLEEDNSTSVGDCEMRLTTDGQVIYNTSHYGGTDLPSDAVGEFNQGFDLLHRKYLGTSDPIPAYNLLEYYYNGGDVPVEGFIEPNPVNSTGIFLNLPDFRLPGEPVNLSAMTLSHEAIEVVFEPSPSADVTHYEIWMNSMGEWEWQRNETVPGSFLFEGLVPDTEYGFRVEAVDDAGLRNSTEAWNRTFPPIEGMLEGIATYEGGPLNGTPAENATVILLNSTGAEVGNMTTGPSGYYLFEDVLFGPDHTLIAYPEDMIEPGEEGMGYLAWSHTFDFGETMQIDITFDHYENLTPTSDTLEVLVTYVGGPNNGQNATNATIFIFNSTGAEIVNKTADETGLVIFQDLAFGTNYTIKGIPVSAVIKGGMMDGYVERVHVMDFDEGSFLHMELEYYTYVAPTGGPIYGRVLFSGGPMDGQPVPMAKVEVLSSGTSFAYVNTNSTGHYTLSSIGFGTNYTIRVTPASADLGVVDNNSGYLVKVSSAFDHDDPDGIQVDLELEYYEYDPTQPQEEHPSVTIVDEKGDPVEGVEVTVTIDGTTYTATTDENGVAVFEDLNGTTFPEGSSFKAAKDGYEDTEWDLGDSVPSLLEKEEDEDEGPNLLLIIIVIVVVLLVLGILVVLLKRKEADFEEE